MGDKVFVIGSPYGLSHSLTVGHVSARYASNSLVSLPGAAELLQTDAAINSGNSGSPMFNMSVLLEINGIPVTAAEGNFDQIYASLGQLKAGERLRSKVLRAGEVIELSTIITPQ